MLEEVRQELERPTLLLFSAKKKVRFANDTEAT
jgi:hypothetical protein